MRNRSRATWPHEPCQAGNRAALSGSSRVPRGRRFRAGCMGSGHSFVFKGGCAVLFWIEFLSIGAGADAAHAPHCRGAHCASVGNFLCAGDVRRIRRLCRGRHNGRPYGILLEIGASMGRALGVMSTRVPKGSPRARNAPLRLRHFHSPLSTLKTTPNS